MRLFTIKNQSDQPPYGELVLQNDKGEVIYDIVYDGKGYHNYPHWLDGDYRQAREQWNTYGWKGLTEYLDYLDKRYKMKVERRRRMIEEVVSVVIPSKGWTVVESIPYFIRRVSKEKK